MLASSSKMMSKRLARGMATRTPIVGGNWKLNPGSSAEVNVLMTGLSAGDKPNCEVFVCPPALHLLGVHGSAPAWMDVASQNVYKESSGAFTGETSVAMLQDVGVSRTLIGHSERRDIFGETDELLGAKIAHCQAAGLNVVACCGEHLEDREAGKTMEKLIPQLQAMVDNVSDWSRVVIAYEPVWAIGTGVVATPEQAQETHANIREWLAGAASAQVADQVRIQYGGSVTDENAPDLTAGADIDGFLVGGASLKADKFLAILHTF